MPSSAKSAALISAGCSRSDAARYVGCAVSTIQNSARRDKAFAERLRHAEMNAELAMLRQVREAGARSWRAAAWSLEHLNPQRYARRRADYLTFEEVEQLISTLAGVILRGIEPGPVLKGAIKRLDSLMDDFREVAGRETARDRSRLAKEILAEREAEEETSRKKQRDERVEGREQGTKNTRSGPEETRRE